MKAVLAAFFILLGLTLLCNYIGIPIYIEYLKTRVQAKKINIYDAEKFKGNFEAFIGFLICLTFIALVTLVITFGISLL